MFLPQTANLGLEVRAEWISPSSWIQSSTYTRLKLILLCKNEKMDGTLLILDKELEKKIELNINICNKDSTFIFLPKEPIPQKTPLPQKIKLILRPPHWFHDIARNSVCSNY